MKHCSQCDEHKSLDCFTKDSYSKDGLYYCCKVCKNKYELARRHDDVIIVVCGTCGEPFEKMWYEFKKQQIKKGFSVMCRYCKHEFAPWGFLFAKIKNGCSKRKEELHPEVTNQFIHDLWYMQEGKCWYTDVPLVLPLANPKNNRRTETPGPFDASIDRVDSSISYEPENIVIASTAANFAKNRYSEELFGEWLAAVRKVPNEKVSRLRNVEDRLAGT